jgi:hypothetical protein
MAVEYLKAGRCMKMEFKPVALKKSKRIKETSSKNKEKIFKLF